MTSPHRVSSSKSSSDPKVTAEAHLISLLYANKIEKITEFLDKNVEMDIISIKDARQYTLLHIACLNNQINIAKCLFNHVKYLKVPAQVITEWVNAKTDEWFTALHFASFKGNIELIKLLEQYNANIHAENSQGLTVIHIAAQGDQPVSIAYFRSKGLNTDTPDVKGSTPLHWACFLGMENSAAYLVTLGCSPNIPDKESGLTPLHLAVISGNPRIVRKLLIKGANKNIRNREGKLPIDLSIENEYDNITQLLQNKNWLLSCLNIKPALDKKKSRFSLFLFFFLFLALAGLNIFSIFPYVEQVGWIIAFGSLTVLTFIFFLRSWLTDPGYIKNPNKEDLLNLLLNNDPHLVCPECVIVKPQRSKHCEYCNACISVYDHHCPWINNCVGARNHGRFVVFTMITLFTIIFLFVFAMMNFTFTWTWNDKNVPMPNYKYFPKFQWNEQIQLLFIFKQATCVINLLAFLMFTIPLIALNYVQFYNLFAGKTTSERFGFNATHDNVNQTLLQSFSQDDWNSKMKESVQSSKEKKKWYVNCRNMCCLNKEDTRYTYKIFASPSPRRVDKHITSMDSSPDYSQI